MWVADFGLAKAMEGDEITQSGNVVGTVRYMAPEQLRGEGDPRSDVYSLGITLYELLTGHRAFSATERNGLIQQVLQGELPSPGRINPEVPRDLETIVVKALAREPEHRYQSAAEFESDLRCFLEDRPISARRVSPLERLVRWSRRNPVVASLSGATALLLLLVAVVGFVGYRAELAQRNRAEKNSKLALNALDQIFDRFAPDQTVVLTSTAGDSDGAAPAVVSDETAALLQDLLEFYDQLGKLDDNDINVEIRQASARRRVGDIRQRPGSHEDAILSYEDSLERYGTLRERRANYADDFAIIQARILNSIGTSLRMLNQQIDATQSHQKAIATLETLASHRLAQFEAQFELARTHYLFAWRLRPGEGPVDDVSQLVTPQDLIEGPPRPGPGRSELGSPNALPRLRLDQMVVGEVTDEQVSHFEKAVAILNRLRKSSPDDPRITHLLAVCLLERHPARIPDEESSIEGQPDRPEELLEDLVERFPKTPEFRHALAVSYSHFHFRPAELSFEDRVRVETALKSGLTHAKTLYEAQPTVPAYARSLIHISFQLATIQQSLPRFFGPDFRDMAHQKFSEAERNFRAAKDLQLGLIRRNPDRVSNHLWLARFRRSTSIVLDMQRRADKAVTELKTAIDEITQLNDRLKNTDPCRLMQSSLHRELSNLYDRMDKSDLAIEHDFIARELQSLIRDPSLLGSRPRDRNPNRASDNLPPRRFPRN